MAEIALAVEHALTRRRARGECGRAEPRVLASGDGWRIADVVCTSGPSDRTFEEQHASYSIAVVLAGTFQYRSRTGRALMTPGSLMLGNPGQCFECGHEHGEGDRCVAFWYAPDYFARMQADAGGRNNPVLGVPRIPPVRDLAPVVTAVAANIIEAAQAPWDEIALALAGRAVVLASGVSDQYQPPINAEACITRVVRRLDHSPEAAGTLDQMAEEAGLSPYHFLRTFGRVTGVTPHQYVLRARLREAALRLAARDDKIVDIALDCGFGDVSNFNRAFRAEFGVSPRAYRLRLR